MIGMALGRLGFVYTNSGKISRRRSSNPSLATMFLEITKAP